MTKYLLIFTIALIANLALSQKLDKDCIIELYGFYGKNVMSSKPDKKELKSIGQDFPAKFEFISEFIKETTLPNNDLLTDRFLVLPDTFSLKVVYIIDALYQNPSKKVVYEESVLIDSLLKADIDRKELIDEYYSTIFTSFSNKNKPFDLSKVDFDLEKLVPNDSIGQAIMFLRTMEECGKHIRGYMGFGGEDGIKNAYDLILKYPKFSGKEYYKFISFDFDDFEFEIYNDRGLESYLTNYLGKYYSVLYNHLICIMEITKDRDKGLALWNNSILSNSDFYKYANPRIQEELIKTQKALE
ncbi:MAG: hypothetical protein MK105_15650 [Crocinitomicaceae bacterium]|nr:hypothetical protein [Crocinitomicaceae bacterium]